MTPTAFRRAIIMALRDYGGAYDTDRQLAIAIAPHFGVHFRSVLKWLDGDRDIPGPAVTLAKLYAKRPALLKEVP